MKLLIVRLFLLTGLVAFLQNISFAQNGIPTYQFGNTCNAFNHTIINLPCGQNCTNINFQVPHIKQTSDYEVSSICYTPYQYSTPTGNELTGIYVDDNYSPVQFMPFNFCFYDSVFNKCVIGSNGLLTFDIANAAPCGNSWQQTFQIPYSGGSICSSGAAYYPKSSVMGAFSDLFPVAAASPADRKIEWHVEGTAPGRRFVVSYYHVGTYGLGNNNTPGTCNNLNPTTFQIVLYESTGLIDVYILNKICIATSNANAILGVQDWTRTKARWAPGKNATPWTSVNEGYRFTPTAGASRFLNSEILTISGTHIAYGDTTTTTAGVLDINFPNVCAPGNTQQYLVKTVFTACDDPTNIIVTQDTVTINRSTDLFATATSTATTCGPPSGTIIVTVPAAAGTAPFTYTLDSPPGQVTPSHTYTFTNVSSGPHTVYVSDATGCGSSIPITVALNSTLTVTASATPTSCTGVNNGIITVTPPTGTPPYQYSINGGPYGANNVFNNLAPGTYTVSARDAAGCSGTTTVTITVGPPITATTTSVATTCPGVNNGTITVTPTSGTGPYQYSLDGGAYQTSNTFTNVSSGTHFVVVKDALGCTSNTINVTVGQGAALTGTASSTATSCSGVNNGTITVTPTSGTAPYQYSLDGAPYQSGSQFINVAAGNHTVIFKDVLGCASASIPVIVATGGGITGTANSTATSCPGVNNGTITVTPTSGTSPYQYSLDGAPYQPGNVFINVAAGNHTVVFKDALGCTSANIPVTVTAGAGITATTSTTATSCPGVNNGTITVTPTSGTSPYQYSLDGAPYQAGNIFTNVSTGPHTVVVIDVIGCTSANIPVTVAAGAGVSGTAGSTATSCSGAANGTITATASTGTAPYQYSLDAGAYQPGSTFNNVPAGNHNVLIRDAAGCISSQIPVTVAVGPSLNVTVVPANTSCNGVNNGTITLTPTNGNSPYQYSLNGGPAQTTNVFNNLVPGNYTVTVTDANGCVASNLPAVINAGAGLTASIIQTNVDCNGNTNGSIMVNVNVPATPPYQYSLDNITFVPGNVFNGLAAGNYTVYFRDNLGCTGTQNVTITQPAALAANISTQPVICNGQSNGIINVSVTGGVEPYQYSLNGTAWQSSSTFNVAAGTYTIYVKDNNGCIRTQSNIIISQPPVLTLTTAMQSATCNGGSDGTIIAAASGGSPGFQYSIDGINFQASNVFNVTAGNYTVTVKDVNNCSTTTNTTVGLSNNLTFTKGNDTTICEGTSAQLYLTSNATQYLWTPATALSNPSIANPVAKPTITTQYTVTATLGACSTNGTITVNVNPAPIANGGPDGDICFGQDAQLTASGGTSYQWSPITYLSNPSISNPQVIKPNQSIQYSLQVSDANGCKSLVPDVVNVNVTPPIKIIVSPKDSVVAEGDQIQLTASSVATNYNWSNPSTLSSAVIANPVATMPLGSIGNIYTYTVTGSTSAGCLGTATITLKVYTGPDIYVVNGFTPNGDGKNDKFVPFPVGIRQLTYFRVFNRWGQLLFSTTTLNEGWDGTFAGKEQPSGVYVWIVQGVTKNDKLISKKGTVALIR